MKKEKKYYIYEMRPMLLQVLSLILLILMFLITIFLYKTYNITEYSYIIAYFLLFPYFVLHELIHGLVYILNGADKKKVVYGANLEKGVFCCLVKQNISKKGVLASLISPFIFLGVIPYIIGIIFQNMIIVLLAIMNISGSVGDLVMFFDFLKIKDFEYSEFDNPVGFGLYSANELKTKKLFGLRFIKEEKTLDIKNYQKITISKLSFWAMLVYYLFGVLFLLTI